MTAALILTSLVEADLADSGLISDDECLEGQCALHALQKRANSTSDLDFEAFRETCDPKERHRECEFQECHGDTASNCKGGCNKMGWNSWCFNGGTCRCIGDCTDRGKIGDYDCN